MIQALFFDLDDTLLDFRRSEREALRQTLLAHSLPAEEKILERYHAINLFCWQQMEKGLWSMNEVMTQRFVNLFAELGVDFPAAQCSVEYEERLSAMHYPVEGAEELLKTLSGRYELYFLSNGDSRVQRRRVREAGFEPFIRGLFVSREVGYSKPDRAFFDACLARMDGVSRENAVMIGDSLTSDIRGGRNAGIRTVWMNPYGLSAPEGEGPDAEIRSLPELPGVLEKLDKR